MTDPSVFVTLAGGERASAIAPHLARAGYKWLGGIPFSDPVIKRLLDEEGIAILELKEERYVLGYSPTAAKALLARRPAALRIPALQLPALLPLITIVLE